MTGSAETASEPAWEPGVRIVVDAAAWLATAVGQVAREDIENPALLAELDRAEAAALAAAVALAPYLEALERGVNLAVAR